MLSLLLFKSLRDKNFISSTMKNQKKERKKKIIKANNIILLLWNYSVQRVFECLSVWVVCVIMQAGRGIYCCWNCCDLCACCVLFSRFATIKRTEHFSFETHLLWFSSMRTWERCGRAKILRGTIVNSKKKKERNSNNNTQTCKNN